MANTYSQIIIQVVFAVRNRQGLILPSFEEELYKYISGLIKKKGQLILAINGVSDHIHILISIKPTCLLSDLVREIKKSSNAFINNNYYTNSNFQWQSGYGAFSYNKRQVKMIVNYIKNQKEHHGIKTFKDEYIQLLNDFEVDHNEDYIFKNLL